MRLQQIKSIATTLCTAITWLLVGNSIISQTLAQSNYQQMRNRPLNGGDANGGTNAGITIGPAPNQQNNQNLLRTFQQGSLQGNTSNQPITSQSAIPQRSTRQRAGQQRAGNQDLNQGFSNPQTQNQQAGIAGTNRSSTVRLAPPPNHGDQAAFDYDQIQSNRKRQFDSRVTPATFEEPASFDGEQFINQQNSDPLVGNQQKPNIPLDDEDPLAKPLTPPSEAPGSVFGGLNSSTMKPLVTTGLSLGLVLTLFCAVVWLMRKSGGKSNRALPGEIVEVLGVTAITPKQQMQLVRLGNKILLLSITQQGVQPIGEVTEPEEVARICAVCQSNRPNSMSNTFRQVLTQMENERPSSGFLGSQAQPQMTNQQPQVANQTNTRQQPIGRAMFEA